MARKRVHGAVWIGGLAALVGGAWLVRKGQGKGLRWWLRIPMMAANVLQDNWDRATSDQSFRAQFGEDRLLAYRLRGSLIGCLLKKGYCVEVGANNGVDASNTFYFEQVGWQGICVEADPAMAEECRERRPGFTTVHAAVVAPRTPPSVTFEVVEGNTALSALSFNEEQKEHVVKYAGGFKTKSVMVPAKTLDEILTENHAPQPLDFVTIDVEGHEWGVLQGFNARHWRPQVIILERNGPEMNPQILDYLRENNYRHLRTTPPDTTPGNEWFVPI
jgi:FkbM family methyltransferase